MTPKIDYNLLSEAQRFYEDEGYTYVEVPWIVPKHDIRATLPSPIPFIEAVLHQDDDDDMSHTAYRSMGGLVGSAEQSFLSMNLAPGRYCGITPCFRHERETNLFYQTGFMKLELFDNTKEGDWVKMMAHAEEFFANMMDDDEVVIRQVKTDEGADIQIAGIEVGSYGKREHPDYGEWTYGTGLALPRFSVAYALTSVF